MHKRYVSWSELSDSVSCIIRAMALGDFKPDMIVGLSRGGLVPATMLSHYFGVPLTCVHISTRDHQGSESNLWLPEDAIAGKKLLIVDDINDTGATLNWLKADWESSAAGTDECWGENIKIATIFDNLSSKSEEMVDFCYEEINKAEEDVWIVFPWEEFWHTKV